MKQDDRVPEADHALQGLLIAESEGRMRMVESHEGVVMQVDDDHVVVTYQIDDEYLDQTYRKEQFIGGRLPKKGDRLVIYVHVAELPKERDREKTAGAAPDEQRRHRKRAVRPPREF
jgi:hypothetical protein